VGGRHLRVLSVGARLKAVVGVAASVVIVLGIVLAAHGSKSTHANTGPRPAATTTVPPPDLQAAYGLVSALRNSSLSVSAGFYGEGSGRTPRPSRSPTDQAARVKGGWPGFVIVSNSGQTLRTRTQHVRQNAPPEPVWTTIELKPGAKASLDVYN